MKYEVDGFFFVDVMGLTVYNFDGTIRALADQITTWTIANTEETEDIVGRGGATIKTIKRNKSSVFTLENAKNSFRMWEIQTGGTANRGLNNEGVETRVKISDQIVTKVADSVVLTHTPVGTIGNEVPEIFIYTNNGLGKRFTQDTVAAAGTYTFNPTTNTVTFFAGEVPMGTSLMAYYERNLMAVVMSNPATIFSGAYPCSLDFLAEDGCGDLYHIRVDIPRGEFTGNFDITGGTTIGTSTIEITATATTGSCPGVTYSGNNLWNLVLFFDSAPDVPIVPIVPEL